MNDSMNFRFHLYTEIVFGRNAVSGIAALVHKYGGTKVMFVYGEGSIKRSGLYDRVKSELGGGGIPYVEFGGAKANPLRSHADEGMKLAREEGVDFFLGVGGGSAIDTAKAIALAAANDGEYWPYYRGTKPTRMAPVGTINTIAAAGSEMSGSTVLVDDIGGEGKCGLMWPPVCRPVFAIMDPTLMYSLPAKQTAAGAADIFAHTFMRYFSQYDSYLSDEYCIATLNTVVRFAPVALAHPNDFDARAQLMLAAAFSHNDLTEIGKPHNGMGGEHALERQLSGHYDFPHGEGLAVIMPAYMKYMVAHGSERDLAKVANLGARVFGPLAASVASADADTRAAAYEGIEKFTEWLRSLGLPTTLRELGIPEGELKAAAERCVENTGGSIKGYMELDADAIREIFALAE
ncbi:MAG: iron-containing alcohol dehydrogenase [Clostridiales Family XIII bacterium]|jgi:alcohol dehydrogenase YqhD (iron-dependent ADH family)|nr:iron-containing alcohol dehydrogenase [Clostridiales Family XIII bacterium]